MAAGDAASPAGAVVALHARKNAGEAVGRQVRGRNIAAACRVQLAQRDSGRVRVSLHGSYTDR
jgi:hypothetical protein